MRCLFLIIILITFLTGCGFDRDNAKHTTTRTYSVTDDLGNVLQFDKKPTKIYASTLSLEEVLVDLVSPDRIVAISEMATDDKLSLISQKASLVNKKIQGRIGVEGILSLNPDLVLMQDNMDATIINSLKDVGLKVFVSNVPVTVEMIGKRILKISQAVGEEEKGKKLVGEMWSKILKSQEKLSSLTDNDKKIIMAYSQQGVFGSAKGVFNDICNKALVKNGAAMAGLVRGEHLSKEKIIEYNPDIFIFPSYDTGKYGNLDLFIQEVLNDPALTNVKAIKNNNIMIIKDRYRSTTSHYVGDAILEISKNAYPQYFEESN